MMTCLREVKWDGVSQVKCLRRGASARVEVELLAGLEKVQDEVEVPVGKIDASPQPTVCTTVGETLHPRDQIFSKMLRSELHDEAVIVNRGVALHGPRVHMLLGLFSISLLSVMCIN
jgi:hypothetical protein